MKPERENGIFRTKFIFRAQRGIQGDFLNTILQKSFKLEVWGSVRQRGFEHGTKYGFFKVAKKAIEFGANFYKTIVQSDEYRPLILDRVSQWQMGRGADQEDVITFFDQQGVYNRDMYNELLKKAIKAHNIEKIMEALAGHACMATISENEHDICKVNCCDVRKTLEGSFI